ncbi:hypothetical protein M501DRAFT_374591 [Patellaria atrata CBS 101060]|uniref:Uncharacterized protein n=1 Tax=Patellaria atrata CBS 101060 TaxID=1346257 RepID=A0A9P4VVS8_9PEZI|nr:hypothetical protein M501DRAFT_374591 [Patellaria atrata CBS 101060]
MAQTTRKYGSYETVAAPVDSKPIYRRVPVVFADPGIEQSFSSDEEDTEEGGVPKTNPLESTSEEGGVSVVDVDIPKASDPESDKAAEEMPSADDSGANAELPSDGPEVIGESKDPTTTNDEPGVNTFILRIPKQVAKCDDIGCADRQRRNR